MDFKDFLDNDELKEIAIVKELFTDALALKMTKFHKCSQVSLALALTVRLLERKYVHLDEKELKTELREVLTEISHELLRENVMLKNGVPLVNIFEDMLEEGM